MLHPVGPLPTAVYWRRRLLVLTVLVAVLGGGGWLGVSLLTGATGAPGASAAGTTSAPASEPAGAPALEQVVPSLASVRTPTLPATPTVEPVAPPAPAGPQPGDPCSDDMISVEVQAPGSSPAGGKPTFDLVVTNVSPVPCVRALDKELQEIVLLDTAGNRLWGSNDCFPEQSDDVRTLDPGEQAAFPLVWSGLTSEPTCTVERVTLGPGDYLLRGRLAARQSPEAPFTVV